MNGVKIQQMLGLDLPWFEGVYRVIGADGRLSDAGVVDQDIDAAALFRRGGDDAGAIVILAHVRRPRMNPGCGILGGGNGVANPVAIDIDGQNLGTGFGQCDGHGLAQAPGGAGHDRRLAVQ